MATNYFPVGSFRTIRVYGPTSISEVEFVTVQTIPSGLIFSMPIPLEVWQRNQGGEQLGLIADLLENLVANYHVVGGSPSQDVDASGLLVDYVDLTVSYDQGLTGRPALEGTVREKIQEVALWATDPHIAEAAGLPLPTDAVGQEYARLQALAGG